jgi:hypothetical protein
VDLALPSAPSITKTGCSDPARNAPSNHAITRIKASASTLISERSISIEPPVSGNGSGRISGPRKKLTGALWVTRHLSGPTSTTRRSSSARSKKIRPS